MLAYHNNPAIKAKYLTRVRAHREADQLIHGTYWEDGKGCAVGCTIHSREHSRYETELGIPQVLARLEDGIFEGLKNGEAQNWPEAFLEAIPVGADLSMTWPKFSIWLLIDPNNGVIRHAKKSADAVRGVAALYQRLVDGDKPAPDEWVKARSSAYAAAYAAHAYAYAYASADAYAAAAAADAASAATPERPAASASAAHASAASAAHASADAAARNKARSAQSKKLLELLAASPVMSEPVTK